MTSQRIPKRQRKAPTNTSVAGTADAEELVDPTPAPQPARRRGAVRVVAGLLVTALLGVMAVTLAAATLPRALGYKTLIVRSGSMGKAHPTGSLAVSRWMPGGEIRVGDPILIKDRAKAKTVPPVLHRVHTLELIEGQRVVQTKGDANDFIDPERYVLPERVLVPAYTIPYMGYLVATVTTRVGWALLLVLPATILCASVLISIWSTDPKAEAKPPAAATA